MTVMQMQTQQHQGGAGDKGGSVAHLRCSSGHVVRRRQRHGGGVAVELRGGGITVAASCQ